MAIVDTGEGKNIENISNDDVSNNKFSKYNKNYVYFVRVVNTPRERNKSPYSCKKLTKTLFRITFYNFEDIPYDNKYTNISNFIQNAVSLIELT